MLNNPEKTKILILSLLLIFPILVKAAETGFWWGSNDTNATTTDAILISDINVAITDEGKVGIGTTEPRNLIHLYSDDTPGFILEQSDELWDHYTWNFFGNEAGFFVQDGTNYPEFMPVPFKILSGAKNDTLKLLGSDSGSIWVDNNVSAASYTDRTPGFTGNALAALAPVGQSQDGKINHSSLPEAARKQIKIQVPIYDSQCDSEAQMHNRSGKDCIVSYSEEIIEERDLGMMISILVKAVQELDQRTQNKK